MAETVKESISSQEYEKVGQMLLELVSECPYVPENIKNKPGGIQFQNKGTETGVFILANSGNIKSRNVLGGFTATLNIQVAYQSFPTTNMQRINAQDVVDKIMGWLEEVKELPQLTGNRTITSITASSSFAVVEDVGEDKSTVFVADAVLEYEAE